MARRKEFPHNETKHSSNACALVNVGQLQAECIAHLATDWMTLEEVSLMLVRNLSVPPFRISRKPPPMAGSASYTPGDSNNACQKSFYRTRVSTNISDTCTQEMSLCNVSQSSHNTWQEQRTVLYSKMPRFLRIMQLKL